MYSLCEYYNVKKGFKMNIYSIFSGLPTVNAVTIRSNFIYSKDEPIGSRIINDSNEYSSAVEDTDILDNQDKKYSILSPIKDNANTTRSIHHHMYDNAHQINTLARNGLYSPYLNIENSINNLYQTTSRQTFYTIRQSGVQ